MARSKYKGVGRVKDNEKKPYRAFCDRRHVGYYETPEEAAKARDLQVLALEFLQGREVSASTNLWQLRSKMLLHTHGYGQHSVA